MLNLTKSNSKHFVVLNLKNTYVDLGKYSFKIVLGKKFIDAKHCTIKIIDSDGKDMEYILNYWGRKMNIEFTINKNVSDGIAAIDLTIKEDETKVVETNRLFFWVVK